MKETLKPNVEERPELIVTGIISFYLIIEGFILYLFLMHKISILTTLVATFLFIIIYIPRFLIINKLKNMDNVKIIEEYIMINNYGIPVSEIEKYLVKESKPQMIFFISNKMIIFKEAVFMIKTSTEIKSFKVVGTEKIRLLKEFLSVSSQK